MWPVFAVKSDTSLVGAENRIQLGQVRRLQGTAPPKPTGLLFPLFSGTIESTL